MTRLDIVIRAYLAIVDIACWIGFGWVFFSLRVGEKPYRLVKYYLAIMALMGLAATALAYIII